MCECVCLCELSGNISLGKEKARTVGFFFSRNVLNLKETKFMLRTALIGRHHDHRKKYILVSSYR